MSSNLQAVEMELNTVDSSLPTTPRSVQFYNNTDPSQQQQQRQVRFMCSFNGKILPRPQDNQLRYIGGDTRIVAVSRNSSFSSLLSRLSKLSGTPNINVKYQLPTEDLDSLITVSSDEDVENMMEEYDRLVLNQKSARLRLFLFPNDAVSRTSSISSFLDGSSKREQWFLDALNAGSGLERGRSEVSSIVSEVPDYLFGLDNSDEPSHQGSKLKNNSRMVGVDTVSVSDPGSPAAVVSSPFCSTSSTLGTPNVNVMPDLRPVKTKPENTPVDNTERVMVNHHQMWNYSRQQVEPVQPMPVYYVQPGSNIPVQPVAIRTPYAQPYPLAPGQVPVGYSHQIPGGIRQVYGGLRPTVSMEQYDGGSPIYYGVRNPGMVPTYQGVMAPGVEEWHGSGIEERSGRASPVP